MANSQIRGDTQIQDNSIPKEKLQSPLGLDTSDLQDGTEFLKRDGSVPMTAEQSMGDNKLTDLADPALPQDAVNKRTLDTAIASVGGSGGSSNSFFPSGW